MCRIYDVNDGSYDVAKGFEGRHVDTMARSESHINLHDGYPAIIYME